MAYGLINNCVLSLSSVVDDELQILIINYICINICFTTYVQGKKKVFALFGFENRKFMVSYHLPQTHVQQNYQRPVHTDSVQIAGHRGWSSVVLQ